MKKIVIWLGFYAVVVFRMISSTIFYKVLFADWILIKLNYNDIFIFRFCLGNLMKTVMKISLTQLAIPLPTVVIKKLPMLDKSWRQVQLQQILVQCLALHPPQYLISNLLVWLWQVHLFPGSLVRTPIPRIIQRLPQICQQNPIKVVVPMTLTLVTVLDQMTNRYHLCEKTRLLR